MEEVKTEGKLSEKERLENIETLLGVANVTWHIMREATQSGQPETSDAEDDVRFLLRLAEKGLQAEELEKDLKAQESKERK